jgi:delta 1-pyrroline-5-carboxylate dehydrogenase
MRITELSNVNGRSVVATGGAPDCVSRVPLPTIARMTPSDLDAGRSNARSRNSVRVPRAKRSMSPIARARTQRSMRWSVVAATIDVLNPATGEVLSPWPRTNAAQLNEAVAAAKAVFTGWSRYAWNERATLLTRITDAFDARIDEFARMES